MIRGKAMKEMNTITKPDVNYRALSSLNCSMIKLFDNDPVKFFEQFKLGKKRDDKSTTSTTIGDIVDFYLLDCKGDEDEFDHRFEEKYALLEGSKGSGQVFILADTLFHITMGDMNDEGEITTTFETRFSEAFNKIKALGKYYTGKKEKEALDDFNKKGYDYFEMMLNNVGKTVVDKSLIDKSKKIAKILMEDEFTKEMFVNSDEEHTEDFYKFPIEWKYKCKNGKVMDCKSEIDMMRIDHSRNIIFLRDLKTTYDNENFEFSYIKRGYYLQAAFYYKAVQYWAKMEGMEDYRIVPMQFVVGDTSMNNRRPIVYFTTEEDLKMSMEGFTLKGGIPHKGLESIIEEIAWAEENDSWNCSKIVHDNSGVMPLSLNYEK